MIEKIAYNWYPTTDMDRAVAFYKDVLGLKLLFKREDWSEFDVAGRFLALSKVDTLSSDRPTAEPGISFIAQPIEEVMDALAKKGVIFLEELQVYPYGKLVHFQDPDGNVLGLYEPPPETSSA